MRIKSYFAPSVQAAIALARKEFGNAVTLVTSHIAAHENRALGEYEVVFAIEEQAVPSSAATVIPQEQTTEPTQFTAFQDLLLQAVSAPPSTQNRVPEKLADIRGALIELGMQPAPVIQVMSLIEQLLGIHSRGGLQPDHSSDLKVEESVSSTAEEQINSFEQTGSASEQVPSARSGLTAAELLFAQSVNRTNPSHGARS